MLPRVSCLALAAALCAPPLPGAPANAGAVRIEMRSADDREALARDRFVVHDRKAGALRLAGSYLISHAVGKSVKRSDRLGGRDQARISFEIPSAEVRGGILYLFGGEGGELEVNGLPVEAPDRHGHAGWAGRAIPARALRAGLNRFTFKSGTLTIDTGAIDPGGGGGRSERSFDGGRTFRDGLGTSGDLSGEYLARLRVQGHPPRGSVLSPPIDLGAEAAPSRLTARMAVAWITLAADARVPEGTAIRYQARFGQGPRPDPRTWTDWIALNPGNAIRLEPASKGRRFFQWRAELSTTRADRTPELAGISVQAETALDEPLAAVTVVDRPRWRSLPTFYPFKHQGPHPRLRHLREKHRLDEPLARAATELDRQAELRLWVGDAWVESWDGGKLDYIPPWDALEILELAPAGLAMGMCTHKAVTYVQAAAAVGYNARTLIVSGHCLAEVWSNQLGRWVLQDPGPGLDAEKKRTLGCRYDVRGEPASALDVLRSGEKAVVAVPHPRDRGARDTEGVWCGRYDRFGIPLRNDHLTCPEPAEEEHGYAHYRYDGYLWWSDDLDDPAYGEYSFLSNRAADFYPALNAAGIELREASPGVIEVSLHSDAPNLARYRVRVGDREEVRGEEPFIWKLEAGENRLEARAENAFGVSGPPARATLRYEP